MNQDPEPAEVSRTPAASPTTGVPSGTDQPADEVMPTPGPPVRPAAAPTVAPAAPAPQTPAQPAGTAVPAAPSDAKLAEPAADLPLGLATAQVERTPATPAELTARVGTSVVPAVARHRLWARAQALNWRLYLIRFTCSGLAVLLTVVLLPGLRFTQFRWGMFTEIAVIFGMLNALVKPILQFLVLRFIFSTYGLVIVLINMLLLLLLDQILDDVIQVSSVLAAILGGLGVGVFGLMFETLLGANPPITDSARRAKEDRG